MENNNNNNNNNNNAAVDLDSKGRPRLCKYDCDNNEYYRQINTALNIADEIMDGDPHVRPRSGQELIDTLKKSSCWASLNLVTRPIVELCLLRKWNLFRRADHVEWPREAEGLEFNRVVEWLGDDFRTRAGDEDE
jgi:hypothetical protein